MADRGEPRSNAIDRLVHEPARFLIMSQLFAIDACDFVFLRRQTGLTRGNLSSHMHKLEAARYIEIEKGFVGKLPRTLLRLTDTGRQAYQRYTVKMRALLDDAPTNHGPPP